MDINTAQVHVSQADTRAIQDVAKRLVLSWNAGDGKVYGESFTEDADYITFNGDHFHGRHAIGLSHQVLFDTYLRGSELKFEKMDMRRLDQDIILVHCIGNSRLKGQKKFKKSRRSIQTLVARRTKTGWLFESFHNTRMFKITPFRAVLLMLGL